MALDPTSVRQFLDSGAIGSPTGLDNTSVRRYLDRLEGGQTWYGAERPPEPASFMGDLPELGAMALGNLSGALYGGAEYVGSALGFEPLTSFAAEARRSVDDFMRERYSELSPETQQAMQREWATLGPEAAWKSGRSIAASAITNAAFIAPTIVSGGLAAMGTGLGARLLGVSGLGVEGILAGGAMYGEIANEVEKTPENQLVAESPRYAELRQTMSPGEARDQLIRESADAIAPLVAAATVGLGAAGGRLASAAARRTPGVRAATASPGRVVGGTARGAIEEFGQEALQSAGEATLGNVAAQVYDPSRAITEDLLEQTIGGAVTGGALGGALGGVFNQRPWPAAGRRLARQPEAGNQDLTSGKASTEGVADAIQSRPEALPLATPVGRVQRAPSGREPRQIEMDLQGGEAVAPTRPQPPAALPPPPPGTYIEPPSPQMDMLAGEQMALPLEGGVNPPVPRETQPALRQVPYQPRNAMEAALLESGLAQPPVDVYQGPLRQQAYVQPGIPNIVSTPAPGQMELPLEGGMRREDIDRVVGGTAAALPEAEGRARSDEIRTRWRERREERRQERVQEAERQRARRLRERPGVRLRPETAFPTPEAPEAPPAAPTFPPRSRMRKISEALSRNPPGSMTRAQVAEHVDKLSKLTPVQQGRYMAERAQKAKEPEERAYWNRALKATSRRKPVKRPEKRPPTPKEMKETSERREARLAEEKPAARGKVPQTAALLVQAPGRRIGYGTADIESKEDRGGERGTAARSIVETNPELYDRMRQIFIAVMAAAYNRAVAAQVQAVYYDGEESSTQGRKLNRMHTTARKILNEVAAISDALVELRGANDPQGTAEAFARALYAAESTLNTMYNRRILRAFRKAIRTGNLDQFQSELNAIFEGPIKKALARSLLEAKAAIDAIRDPKHRDKYIDTLNIEINPLRGKTWSRDQMHDILLGRMRQPAGTPADVRNMVKTLDQMDIVSHGWVERESTGKGPKGVYQVRTYDLVGAASIDQQTLHDALVELTYEHEAIPGRRTDKFTEDRQKWFDDQIEKLLGEVQRAEEVSDTALARAFRKARAETAPPPEPPEPPVRTPPPVDPGSETGPPPIKGPPRKEPPKKRRLPPRLRELDLTPEEPTDVKTRPPEGSVGEDRPEPAVVGTTPRAGGGRRTDIQVVDRDLLPEPDAHVAKRPYSDRLSGDQILAANLAVDRYLSGKDGFMLADGTGVGKTHTQVAVADMLRDRTDKPIVIVTQNTTTVAQYQKAAADLGIDLAERNIAVTTYSGMKKKLDPGVTYGALIFDEAQNLKNTDRTAKPSAQAQFAEKLKSEFRMFATATPFDSIAHSGYFLSTLLNMSETEAFRQVGIRLLPSRPGSKAKDRIEFLDDNPRGDSVLMRIAQLRQRLIKEGAWVRRAFPFWGDIYDHTVELSPEREQELQQDHDRLEQWWDAHIDSTPNRQVARNRKGQKTQEMARWLESTKVDAILELVKQELAAGRRVVVLGQTAKEGMKVKGLGVSAQGLATALADRLERENISFLQAAGGNDARRKRAKERFQRGEASVIIGTVRGMGTGVDLDDSVGDAPRTLILASPTWTASQLDQATGRVSRAFTQTPAKMINVHYTPGTLPQEDANIRRMRNSMRTLQEIQGGADLDTAIGDETVNVEVVTQEESPFEQAPRVDQSYVRPDRMRRASRGHAQIQQHVRAGQASLNDMLDAVSQLLPKNDRRQKLIQRLKALNLDVPVLFQEMGAPGMFSFPYKRGMDQGGNTHYRPTTPEIQLSPTLHQMSADTIAHVVLHEAVHAVTHAPMLGDVEFAQAVNQIYQRALATPGINGSYWKTSANEFLAEAMTNSVLQADLAKAGTNRSLWRRLVDAMRKLLRLPPTARAHSMLDEVMRVFERGARPLDRQRQWVAEPDFQAARMAALGSGTDNYEQAMIRLMDGETATVATQGMNIVQQLMYESRWSDLFSNAPYRAREIGLGALTLRQLAQRYSKLFVDGTKNALEKFAELEGRRHARSRALQRVPEDLIKKWVTLQQTPAFKAVAELLLNDTRYGTWSDLELSHPNNAHLKTQTEKARWRKQRDIYEALPIQARTLVDELRSWFENDWNATVNLLTENIFAAYKIPRTEALNKLVPFKEGEERAVWRGRLSLAVQAEVEDAKPKKVKDFVAAIQEVNERSKTQGPYFPLRRYGRWVVEAKKEERRQVKTTEEFETLRDELWDDDPGTTVKFTQDKGAPEGQGEVTITRRVVTFYEGIAHARKEQAAAEASGEWDSVSKVTLKRDYTLKGQDIGLSSLAYLESQLGENSRQINAIRAAMVQLMPDTSIRKAQLRRQNIEGYSLDALRSFANYSKASAYWQAQLEYGKQLATQVEEMSNIAKALGGEDSETSITAGQVVAEIRKRDTLNSQGPGDTLGESIAGGLANWGFLWYLVGPSYLIVNMTQPWVIGMPYVAARYGMAPTMKVMGDVNQLYSNYLHAWRQGLDEQRRSLSKPTLPGQDRLHTLDLVQQSGLFKPEEQEKAIEMLTTLEDRGILSFTLAADLREAATGQMRDGGSWLQRAQDLMRVWPHAVEVLNRNIMALTAYRLELDKSGSHEKAVRAADDAVWQTQFDYSGPNKPRYFQPALLRPVLMFKQHAQHVYMLLISEVERAVRGASKDEKFEAFKTVAGILGMHAAAAGALGMVFEPVKWAFVTAAWALSAVGLAEDDDRDWETVFRQWAHDSFGPNIGEVLARGLPRVVGVDLSNRIGLDSMLLLDSGQTKEGREAVAQFLYQLGGPLVGMTGNFFEGVNDIGEGATLQGVSRMVPKVARDLITSRRFGTEGMLDARGNVIRDTKELTPWQLGVQAMGFTPADVAEVYESRRAVKGREMTAKRRRDKLIERYRRASPEKRRRLLREDIREFNKAYPMFRVTMGTLTRSMAQKRKREREAARHRGVFVDRKYRALYDEGRFANL